MERLKQQKNLITIIFVFLMGVILWFSPKPQGMNLAAWHLFAIFAPTVVGIILKPLPMSVITLLSLTVAIITSTLSFSDAFSGFSNEIVWLVIFAFFISRGFISTGLGRRMAYKIMSLVGKNSLGLGYGLIATDFILAPAIPSVTARAGGIVFPILKALTEVFTGKSHDPRMGAFLTLTAFQGMAITSSMFLTSMAGNPLIAELAQARGITITWSSWAVAAIVPGLISLIVIPYVIYRCISPIIRKTPHAREMAEERLRDMGPMKWKELVVLATFFLLITLWISGASIGVSATAAAMIGLSIFFLTGILSWKEILEEHTAWDTFIWFSTLVTLATFLNKLGFTSWFSQWVVSQTEGFNWIIGFSFVSLLYFYSHYFFASSVAHICAMYAPFLIVAIALGTPPELAALILAFYSSLFGGLTHYSSGPAPIFFGTGTVPIGQWWKMGAIVGTLNVMIWMFFGGLWWKILGLW
jgi:DASS family divalent anion:Na+ symporter